MKNHNIYTHPQLEKELGVPDDHCIIDRKELKAGNILPVDELIFAQNKKRLKGYTVFYLPLKGGDFIQMMTLKDVLAIINKFKKRLKK
jgi:hypothetical protein